MKFNIINKTPYLTRDIKKIIKECVIRDGEYPFSQLNVEVLMSTPRACNYVRGRAMVDGAWMQLRLNNPKSAFGPSTAEQLADTVFHELKHMEGWRSHRKIRELFEPFDTTWIDEHFPLRLKSSFLAAKPKPKVSVAEARYVKVLQRIDRYEKKLRRLQNALKKLYRKKKYYEKKLGKGEGNNV